jgi:hypothetical protein
MGARLARLAGLALGFDRKQLPDIDRKIAEFFRKHLLP